MTINDAIEMVDRRKPNQFDTETKIGWLSKLDGMIWREIFLTHEGNPLPEFRGYDGTTPMDTPLLAAYPYGEDVYNYFLQAQIDAENGEMAKYNQSITLYNSAYRLYQDWYNRTHFPKTACRNREFVF